MRAITSVLKTDDYGKLVIKLDKLCENVGITKTKLSRLADADYRAIKRLFEGSNEKLDVDVLTRICYVLECDISDILEYQLPEQE